MPIQPLLSVSLSSTVYTWLAGWGVFEDPLQPATTALGIRIQGTSPLSPWALVCIRRVLTQRATVCGFAFGTADRDR